VYVRVLFVELLAQRGEFGLGRARDGELDGRAFQRAARLEDLARFLGRRLGSLPSPLAQSSLQIGGTGLGVCPLQGVIPVSVLCSRPCSITCCAARAGAWQCSPSCRTATRVFHAHPTFT
jgi:hypothetical protein